PSRGSTCWPSRNGGSSTGRRRRPGGYFRPASRTTGERSRRFMNDAQILSLRPAKNAVDPARPYAFLVEPERTRAGVVEDAAVLFLTNRECPFRCLICDLWKNTTDARVPDGAIARQIEYALSRLPPARHIKLYNAGN